MQTRFCGEWNLEFGSNTTENLKSHEAKPSEISNFLWCLKAKFQIPLSAKACLQLTPLSTRNYHSKSVEFEPNSHRFFKICENLAKMWCLSQTPQILSQTPQMLVKFHRFEWMIWVESGVKSRR